MKKVLLILMTLCMALPALAADFYDEESGLYFSITSEEISDNQTVEVTYGGEEGEATPEYTGEITIPETVTYQGTIYTVTGIGEAAFAGCGLTSINIPETVTSIGNEAFYYAAYLKSIDIPDNVTKMGTYAFSCCYSLESVTFGSGLTEILEGAFEACTSLKEVIIPEGVVYIGDWALGWCFSLAKVSLPSTLTSIGSETFTDSGLKEIKVAEGNEYYCAVDNVLFTKNMTTLVQYPIGLETTTYEIPSGVTTIADSSFSSGFNLTSVTIPATVTTIENYAFEYCTGITSITILCETAPTCANYVFYEVDTSNIILYVPKGYSSAYSSTSPWSGFDIEEIVEVGEKVCIDGIYYIVGDGTLTVTYGGDSYENGTEEYTGDIAIPKTIVYAGTQCTVAVGEYAFANCTGITSITVDSETPPTCAENAFTGLTTSEITLYVPYGCTSVYSTVSPWSGFNIVEIVAELGDRIKVDGMYYNVIAEAELEVTYGGALWYPTSEYTGEITIPETVTYQGTTYTVTGIGELAFCYCGLTSINIPETVTYIGACAFCYCGLTSINIPETVTYIGYSAFEGAYLLTSVEIPNSVTTMGEWAFANCSFLESVTIGSGLTEIPEDAFGYCASLKEVIIPEGVTSIGTYAFEYCANLELEYLPESLTYIGKRAFEYCTNLELEYLPESLTYIGDYAFDGCEKAFKEVVIGNNVEYVGQFAFHSSGVGSVIIGSSVNCIQVYAFQSCPSLTSFTMLNPEPSISCNVLWVNEQGNTINVYVPAGTYATYAKAGWESISRVNSTLNELDYAVLKIGSTGYSTYYNEDYDIDISDTGIKAYWAEGIEDEDGTSVVTLMNIGTTIPAKTAVVFNGSQTDLTEAPATAPSVESEYSSNMLHGQSTTGTIQTEEGYLYYILTTGGDNGEVGFYYGAEDGGAFESAANKAWLAVPEDEQRNGLSIKFKEEDDATGISSIENASEAKVSGIYTIQGVRVGNMNQPGLYIVDGKKVLVK